jgi:hypothetical protein
MNGIKACPGKEPAVDLQAKTIEEGVDETVILFTV